MWLELNNLVGVGVRGVKQKVTKWQCKASLFKAKNVVNVTFLKTYTGDDQYKRICYPILPELIFDKSKHNLYTPFSVVKHWLITNKIIKAIWTQLFRIIQSNLNLIATTLWWNEIKQSSYRLVIIKSPQESDSLR